MSQQVLNNETHEDYKLLLLGAILVSLLPFLWLFSDTATLGGFTYALANISGFIGGALMFWMTILGMRGVMQRITHDYLWLLKLHKYLAVYGAFFVLLHPILEMMSYLEGWLWLFWPDLSSNRELYFTYGRISFILFLIVWFTSALVKERIRFRPWLYIHYLSYPTLFLGLLHAVDVGTYLQKYPFIRNYWWALLIGFGGDRAGQTRAVAQLEQGPLSAGGRHAPAR